MNQSQFLNNTVTTTTSSSTSTSSSKLTRTKLPNFAAIHQKQFQKMENLADHVARKQERSKVLINSTSKIRPGKKNTIYLLFNIFTDKTYCSCTVYPIVVLLALKCNISDIF